MKSALAVVSENVALALACMLGVACSSSSSPPSGADASVGTPKVTCNQLMPADIQGLMTATVAGDDVSVVGTDGDGQQCVFHDADNSGQAIDIIVVPSSDPIAGYDAAKTSATNPVAVNGVGDQAFRETGDFQPTAEHGALTCAVSVGEAIQIPGVDALVVNGTLDLTEAQDDILATALGTVCNRLFGTGNTTPDLSGL